MKKLQHIISIVIIALITCGLCDSDKDNNPCPPNVCQNNGCCKMNQLTNLPECTCRSDFAGPQCNKPRMGVIQLRFRSLLSYSEMTDSKSNNYAKNNNLFKTFVVEILNETFSQYSANYSFYYYVNIIGYSAGSIIASTSANIAWQSLTNNYAPVVQLPTKDQILLAMQTICNSPTLGATCAALKIDIPAGNITVNPNVCLDNNLNSCSQNADCYNSSVINYSCVCKPGYRDDSVVGQMGTNCTQMCYKGKCGRGGICVENYGNDCECRCPFFLTGSSCHKISCVGIALILILVHVVILIIIILIRVAIVCHRKNNKMTSSKVNILQDESIESDAYSIAEVDPKYFPEKELHFASGALPEKVAF
jgi:hypothetical protein